MERVPIGTWCAVAWMASLSLAPAAARSWSPQELAAQALANNAELKSYEQGVAAARGERTQAGLFRNPEISVEVGGREVRDSENVLQGNGTTFSISVLQTLEFPGKGTLRKAIANRNVQVAELGLEQFRRALASRVRLLALEYLAASSDSEAATRIARDSATLTKSLQGRELGARQTLELGLIDGNILALQETVRTAEIRRETARAELVALLGWPQTQTVEVRADLTPPSRKLESNQLVLASQKNNPLLRIRQVEAERSKHQLSAARLEVAPDLNIGPFFSRDVAGDVEQNLGGAITAAIPLWDWNTGNIASAKARLDQAEALRVQAEREAEAAVIRTIRIYEITARQLGRMSGKVRSDLRSASSLADQQFRSGAIGVQLYLDLQREYLTGVQIWNGAVLDAWKSLADLDLLTGGAVFGEARP